MITTPEFWLAFSFLLFVILMIKPIKNIFVNQLDVRALDIKREISETEDIKLQAELLLSQFKNKQNSLPSEIEKIIKWAEGEAEALIIENRNKLDEELTRKLELYKQKIQIAENELIKSSYYNMYTIVMQSVEKYLENNLNNIEMQTTMFESNMNSLVTQLKLLKN